MILSKRKLVSKEYENEEALKEIVEDLRVDFPTTLEISFNKSLISNVETYNRELMRLIKKILKACRVEEKHLSIVYRISKEVEEEKIEISLY